MHAFLEAFFSFVKIRLLIFRRCISCFNKRVEEMVGILNFQDHAGVNQFYSICSLKTIGKFCLIYTLYTLMEFELNSSSIWSWF